MNLIEMPIGDLKGGYINAIIEIPEGSRSKYEYDPILEVFKLNRTLFATIHYPAPYGFIPSTVAPDDDPLDILVLTREPTFTGCVIEARPIGVLTMRDERTLDEKIIAVPHTDPFYARTKDYLNLPGQQLDEIEYFFNRYKELEGKETAVIGWGNAQKAKKIIRHYHESFLKGARPKGMREKTDDRKKKTENRKSKRNFSSFFFLSAFFCFLLSVCCSLSSDPAYAGSDRPKLQDEVTKLENELDVLDAKISRKEENLIYYKTLRAEGRGTTDDGSSLDDAINRVQSEIKDFVGKYEVKQRQLNAARAKLKPEEQSEEHYHPKEKEPQVKYPFKK